MYRGLRQFLELLEREGELVRIKCEVSPIEEIAEITDRVSKSEGGGKALLFEQTGTDFQVVTNMFGSPRRMAMALGVGSLEELGDRIESLVKSVTHPMESLSEKLRMLPLLADVSRWFPRKLKGRGACQQVVYMDNEVDLSRLPILKCWQHDGGRFVTLPMVNTIDPDSGIRNVGMYRMQVFDSQTTGMHWHMHKTGARHYEAYRRRGERMPVTVALGGDPAYTYAATAPMPDNMDEYLLAGFLRRRPVRLVKSLTNDIYIPEDCDFVIEGYVEPSEDKVVEGAFGDHTGFYSLTDLYPRFHITAITHRRDAIYPATIVGVPPQEDAAIALATERIFLAPIRLAMQPEVVDMTMPMEGTAHNIAIFSIESRYCGQAHKVVQSMWGAGQMMFNKYMLVTPATTDIRSAEELCSLLRRADVAKSLIRGEGIYDVLDHATATMGFGGKAALDLTDIETLDEPMPVVLPAEFKMVAGVEGVDVRCAESCAALFLFARPSAEVNVAEFLSMNGVVGIKYCVVLDLAANGMPLSDYVWLAAADSDPRRDLTVEQGVLTLDSRSKEPAKGDNPRRFPNVVTSSKRVTDVVDSRWAEYGLGEFVASPSERYRGLLLSDKEDW